jgi:uncharacterized protein YbcV (DUF1398 family)
MNTIETIQAAQKLGASVRPKVGGFPYLAEALRQAGVLTLSFDVPAASGVYITNTGSILQQETPIRNGMVDVPEFNENALVTALRADQNGETTYPEFIEAAWNAGIVRYHVDMNARTCTYYGTQGENYIEQYPAVDLPARNGRS